MIDALVFLVAVTLTALTASVYTRRKVTKEILGDSERLSAAAAVDIVNELLAHPDTREEMRDVIKNYNRGKKQYEDVVTLPKDTDYYKVVMENVEWWKNQYPPTGFHDGQGDGFWLDATEENVEKWIESYDKAVVSGTSTEN